MIYAAPPEPSARGRAGEGRPSVSRTRKRSGSPGTSPEGGVYFFYGEDTLSLLRELRTLKEKFVQKHLRAAVEEFEFGPEHTDRDLRAHLETLFSNQDLFAPEKLLVVRDALSHLPKYPVAEAYVLQNLAAWPSRITAVFAELSALPDKRLRLYKKLLTVSQAKEFVVPTGKAFLDWIKTRLGDEGFMISPSALQELVNRFGEDYSLWEVENELRKLMLYAFPKKTVEGSAIRELIAPHFDRGVFDLTNLAAGGQIREALGVLEGLSAGAGLAAAEEKTQMIQILGALASQIRSLLLVKDLAGLKPAEVAEILNWKPGRVWINQKLAAKFSQEKLAGLLHDLKAIDLRLKTSEEPPKLLLTLFLQKMKAI